MHSILLVSVLCAGAGTTMHAQSDRIPHARIDRKLDNPVRNDPIIPVGVKTEFAVRDITTNGTLNVWVLAGKGEDPLYRPRPLLLHSTDAGVTWSRSEFNYGRILSRIAFADEHVGWMTGSDGLILKTTDGGASWSRQETRTESLLTLIQFLDANRGWVGSDDGEFLRTTDGGATWRSHKLEGHGWVGDEFRGWLNQFSFTDAAHGWFVGDNSQVFFTTDGGRIWRSSARVVERCVGKRTNQKLNLTDVHFFDAQRGILLIDLIDQTPEGERHQGFVLRTQDRGRSWTKAWEQRRRKDWEMEYGPFFCLNFISDNEGWLTASFGRGVFHTKDGGHSWQNQYVPGVDPDNIMTGGIGHLLMIDSNRGWGSVNINDFPLLDRVVRTTDGGRTWQEVKVEN
jgi:photosystem II stability/assembly factor-like uncharacterized protein